MRRNGLSMDGITSSSSAMEVSERRVIYSSESPESSLSVLSCHSGSGSTDSSIWNCRTASQHGRDPDDVAQVSSLNSNTSARLAHVANLEVCGDPDRLASEVCTALNISFRSDPQFHDFGDWLVRACAMFHTE